MPLRVIALAAVVLLTYETGFSQNGSAVGNPDELLGQDNAITTAVPFLAISPDARHAALGDAGVATSPDANSSYWNAGKLAFIDKAYGGTLSYTPWLGKIVNDMSISYLSGFYKISKTQAVSASMKYFDLGDIHFTSATGQPNGDFRPRELAADLTYSRKLTENFAVGISGRYIYSNLTGAFATADAKPGQSVAVDIGAYYTTTFERAKISSLSLGATITNIGAKVTYTDNQNRDFLPTTIRVGGVYTTELDSYNSISFIADFSKLMVPTPPILDTDGTTILHGKDDNRSLIDGMFGSFTDAPDGFKEEMREIMTSLGIEYWYNNMFAARFGYFNEAKTKGNRKYMTVGLGFRRKALGIDVAYLVPVNKRESPLAETLRFTLLLQFPQKSGPDQSLTTD